MRYITNEQGERVSVLLDLDVYNRLANPLALDEECLIGLSPDELQALADSKLAPAAQNQLDDMLVRNAESQLCRQAHIDFIIKSGYTYNTKPVRSLVPLSMTHIIVKVHVAGSEYLRSRIVWRAKREA